MKAVFYDLETSDRCFTGQILNYCFLVVDDSFEVVGELSGLVKLSRLQLPSPGAILANRTDILKHQEAAEDTERVAMEKIARFLSLVTEESHVKVPLIGYNSSRFDLPYLRTSLIRNGINPYFGGRLVYRDLYLLAKKLSVTHPEFPRCPKADAKGEDADRLSLSLETLTTRLGLLTGKQAHESRDDVLLTIKLAKVCNDQFQQDVRRYDAYEAAALHTPQNLGSVRILFHPCWELNGEGVCRREPFALHDCDQRSALWIDLKRYEEGKGRESLQWFGVSSSQLIDGGVCEEKRWRDIAVRAREELRDVRVSNFFETSTCDIEQDIYRLPINQICDLRRAIEFGGCDSAGELQHREARILYARYKLANFDTSGKISAPQRASFENMLKKYGEYRYGGSLQLAKCLKEKNGNGRWDFEPYAPSFEAMLAEVNCALQSATGDDRRLLESLRAWYMTSEIVALCWPEKVEPLTPANGIIDLRDEVRV